MRRRRTHTLPSGCTDRDSKGAPGRKAAAEGALAPGGQLVSHRLPRFFAALACLLAEPVDAGLWLLHRSRARDRIVPTISTIPARPGASK